MYTYLPPSFKANDNVCDIAPQSHCNPTYGASVGRGSFQWKTGEWNTVSQRVRLNDPGQQNGELEVFYEGKSVIKASGLVLRDGDAGRIRGIMMQTFFGGEFSPLIPLQKLDMRYLSLNFRCRQVLGHPQGSRCSLRRFLHRHYRIPLSMRKRTFTTVTTPITYPRSRRVSHSASVNPLLSIGLY